MTSGCGSPCATCGCSPCSCPNPTILNQPRLLAPTVSGGIFTGGTFGGPIINAGTLNNPVINGATLDCASQGCTQPPGTSDATLATTAFVEIEINSLISALNPDFCAAVQTCVAGSPSTCVQVINCINTTPGSINNFLAFDPAVFASTLQVGVARFASLPELQGATPLLAVDASQLDAFFNAGGPNTLWTSFENAVSGILVASPGFCAAVLSCAVAPIASPALTGIPTAPTAVPGTNTTQLATTGFVVAEIAASAGAFAPLASPVFTGDPQAPTPVTSDNDTTIATTAFVQAAILAVSSARFFNATPIGNTAGGADTIAFSHSIPGGTLVVDGDSIEFEATGTFAATASVDKRIRVQFGGSTVFDSGNLAITTAESWNLRGTIFRTGAATQKLTASLTTSDGTVQASASYALGAEALAGAVTMRMLLNATLASDVVAEAYKDRYIAAP